MCSLGKILAQDIQMAAVAKILMRRENQLRRFFPWGISRKHLKHKNAHGDCDATIAKTAADVTHVQSLRRLVLGMRGWACLVLICHQQKRTYGGRERSRAGGIETNTWHRPGNMASEEAGFVSLFLWERNLIQNLPKIFQMAGNVLSWQNLSPRFSDGRKCALLAKS